MSHACYVCSFEPVPDGDGVECPHCHRLQYGSVCALCNRAAPTIVRSFRVFCTACGGERGPLALVDGKPINLIGTTSRWGGKVARGLGWAGVVGGGLGTAVFSWLASAWFGNAALAGVGALFWQLLGIAAGGAAVVSFVALIVGVLAIVGGRKLGEQGEKSLVQARERAIHALAANRGGMLTATDVATALNLQVAEADALLTHLAKSGTRVGVEVDSAGVVNYVFHEVRPRTADGTGVRVDASTGATSPPQDAPSTESGQAEHDVQGGARERVDREFEQLRKLRSGKS